MPSKRSRSKTSKKVTSSSSFSSSSSPSPIVANKLSNSKSFHRENILSDDNHCEPSHVPLEAFSMAGVCALPNFVLISPPTSLDDHKTVVGGGLESKAKTQAKITANSFSLDELPLFMLNHKTADSPEAWEINGKRVQKLRGWLVENRSDQFDFGSFQSEFSHSPPPSDVTKSSSSSSPRGKPNNNKRQRLVSKSTQVDESVIEEDKSSDTTASTSPSTSKGCPRGSKRSKKATTTASTKFCPRQHEKDEEAVRQLQDFMNRVRHMDRWMRYVPPREDPDIMIIDERVRPPPKYVHIKGRLPGRGPEPVIIGALYDPSPRHSGARQFDPFTLPSHSSRHINTLPPEIFAQFFCEFKIHELVSLRRVCHLWANMVASACGLKRSLYLSLTSRPSHKYDTNTFRHKPCAFSLYERLNHVCLNCCNLRIPPANMVGLTIGGKHFHERSALALGRLFSQISSLIINIDFGDIRRTTASNLMKLLEGTGGRLERFIFIMSNEGEKCHFLERLGDVIGTHMPALRHLRLFVNYTSASSHREEMGPYSFLQPSMALTSSIRRLEDFALTCSPHNMVDILAAVGSDAPAGSLERLSIPCWLRKADLARAFEANPNLRNVQALQLTNAFSVRQLNAYLSYFSELQCLQLCHFWAAKHSCVLDERWLAAIGKLKNLTSLKLGHFSLNSNLDRHTYTTRSLPSVQKLTLAAHDLFENFRLPPRPELQQRHPDIPTVSLDFDHLVSVLAAQFPNLGHLTIYTWQETDPRYPNHFHCSIRRRCQAKLPNFHCVQVFMQTPEFKKRGQRLSLNSAAAATAAAAPANP